MFVKSGSIIEALQNDQRPVLHVVECWIHYSGNASFFW